jgi:NAD(P)-dependent dehydrogenase (short-subunit alcohol dehydrogenase family)
MADWELTRVGSKYNAKVIITKVDASQSDQIEDWIGATVREFGRLDGAANVAGIAGGDGETTCATIVSDPELPLAILGRQD